MWTSVHGEDRGFDMIWHSAARITDDGYTRGDGHPVGRHALPRRRDPELARGLPAASTPARATTTTPGRPATATSSAVPASGARSRASPACGRARAWRSCPRSSPTRPARSAIREDPESGLEHNDIKGEASLGVKYSVTRGRHRRGHRATRTSARSRPTPTRSTSTRPSCCAIPSGGPSSRRATTSSAPLQLVLHAHGRRPGAGGQGHRALDQHQRRPTCSPATSTRPTSCPPRSAVRRCSPGPLHGERAARPAEPGQQLPARASWSPTGATMTAARAPSSRATSTSA